MCTFPTNQGTVCANAINQPNNTALTDKVFHHLGGVVRCGGHTQPFLPAGNRRIVNGLDIDVVAAHHDITDRRVLRRIRDLQRETYVRTEEGGISSEEMRSGGAQRSAGRLTLMGMMWLGLFITGRPSSMSMRRSSLTLRWCRSRSERPSSPFSVRTDSWAPASSMGGSEVVKMKPAAYERTVSTSVLVLAM